MERPELVGVLCPECGCSAVERCSLVEALLKGMRNSRYLWCPRCRAICVVDRSSGPERSPE
jgi:hypothetical protein